MKWGCPPPSGGKISYGVFCDGEQGSVRQVSIKQLPFMAMVGLGLAFRVGLGGGHAIFYYYGLCELFAVYCSYFDCIP